MNENLTIKLFHYRYLKDFADKFKLKVQYNTKVAKISLQKCSTDGGAPGGFSVRTEGGDTYSADVVLMACGAMKEWIPDVPGKELATTYGSHSTKKEDYVNKTVCVVGGGNSGFEVRLYRAMEVCVVRG